MDQPRARYELLRLQKHRFRVVWLEQGFSERTGRMMKATNTPIIVLSEELSDLRLIGSMVLVLQLSLPQGHCLYRLIEGNPFRRDDESHRYNDNRVLVATIRPVAASLL
jgi:hypothetical protein